MRSRSHSHKHDDSGLATIEFVLLVPFLATLIFAVASVGGFFYEKTNVTGQAYHAARSVALTGSVGTLPAESTATINAACAPGVKDAVVTVSAGTYDFDIPALTLASRPLTATGKYPCNPAS
jgi:Flp pilus assembly protein TadG